MIKTHFTIHEHYRKGVRRIHWDIRIVRPGKTRTWSFAIPKAKMPKRGEKLLAIKTEDHKLDIMNREGTLKNGDTLKILESGKCEIVKYSDRYIGIIFKGKTFNGHYGFIKTGEDKWLLISAR